MKKVVVLFFAILGFAITAPRWTRAYDQWSALRSGTKRVENLLAAMAATRGNLGAPEAEGAMCLWYKGAYRIPDQHELGRAQDGFVGWRLENKLTGEIGSYEILSSKLEDPGKLKTVLVSLRIDGRPFVFRVPKGAPIESLP